MQMQVDVKKQKEVRITGKAKKADLAKEFQEFKQKIQQFQNKNEQIIGRIREAYSFKKKQIQGQSPHKSQQDRVVYYQRGDQQSVSSSCDYSNGMVYQGNLLTHSQQHLPQHDMPTYNVQPQYANPQHQYFKSANVSTRGYPTQAVQMMQISYSEYAKMQQLREEMQARSSRDMQNVYNEEQEELMERLRSVSERNQELEQVINQKEDIIAQREEEISRMRNVETRFKTYVNAFKRIVADQVENYHEEVVFQRFIEFEKYFKRCDNRLRKLSLKLKDVIQDRRSNATIERSKSRRRSNSRLELRELSSAADMRESYASGPNRDVGRLPPGRRRDTSQQKSVTRNENKQKQFAEIAAGYQLMIKSKTQELQKLQTLLREETASKQRYSTELSRAKMMIDEKNKELNELMSAGGSEREENLPNLEVRESRDLRERLARLEEELRSFQTKERELNMALQKVEKSKKTALEQQKLNHNKIIAKKNGVITELQQRLKQAQSSHLNELTELKDKLMDADKRMMQKDCELMSLSNKLKKFQSDCLLKQQKIKQLQNIITKDNDTQLLDKSMSIDNSQWTNSELRTLQDALHRLEDDNQQKILIIEELEKDRYRFEAELSAVHQEKQKIARGLQSAEKRIKDLQDEDREENTGVNRHYEEKLAMLEECEKERDQLIQEHQQLMVKNSQYMQEVKKVKEENLALNRQLIKANSQLNFSKGQYSNLEQKLARLKQESNDAKNSLNEQLDKKTQKQKQLQSQIRQLKALVQQYQQTILDLEGAVTNKQQREDDNLLNSIHASQLSFNITSHKAIQEEELVTLTQKLKQTQNALEMKEAMEKQIQVQYKNNLQRIRQDLNEKNIEIKRLQTQNQEYKKQLKNMQQQQRDDVSFENYKINLYEEQIVQLQAQCNACKQSEQKLNDLLHQLTENMKEKADEKERLLAQLQHKDKALEELKQLLELKDIKVGKGESIRESLNKDFSLRISADYSEDISDLAEVSYLSNISDVFKRDDLLNDKMKKGKTTREEFVKLFTRTSAYIKSLKANIDAKDKRIKVLERQINGLKNQDKKSWNGQQMTPVFQTRVFKTQNDHDEQSSVEEYKDYDSVQLDTRRHRSYELIKELQHEKALAVEENKMLLNQIQLLQDQILRAQEQENSLVKIKDLYKDEIKKLMENNEVHTQQFELQIKRLREELDDSESYHNWQALKQLFIKMVGCVALLDDPAKGKREEKKKQFEEFVKVVSSILKLDINLRDKLIASIRR